MIPRATYRFQFHREFPFARAEALVPYLHDLGISHVYASPITRAVSGSMHGYDVVDPTTVNPELGGEEALRSLVAALHARGMGLIIDIVPNHMGIAGGENEWWNDVLRHGEASRYARFFDIDWRERLLLPILGAPLDNVLADGQIAVDSSEGEPVLTVYGEHRLPIRPEDQGRLPLAKDRQAIADLLERQHYRLGWWRSANDELNWRRFFTISELAGLRIEDPEVFEATHALYFRLYGEGLIDGVRVDHVDGLTDPAAYCRSLRERLDALPRPAEANPRPAYIVVEKILGPGERLSQEWGVDGTSGYDFMEQAAALLHDPAGEAPLTELWQQFSGRAAAFHEEELRARQDMLSWAFEGQLTACVEAFVALARSAPDTRGLTRGMLRRAIERLLWVFPVYRTYGTGDSAPESDTELRTRVRERARPYDPPGEAEVADRILDWLGGEGPGDAMLAAEAVRRFQQLAAPIAAKAVEDTAFYRYGLLLSRTDVGFDAACFSLPLSDFHAICAARAQSFPDAMLATATHDHKRGEDVRARLAVLSALPALWCEEVERWDAQAAKLHEGVHPADRYMLYQTLYGAWPDGLGIDDQAGLRTYADRVAAWQEKALREAKLRSSWEQPDTAYEGRCRDLVQRMLDPRHAAPWLESIAAFLRGTSAAATANMLVQTALRCTVPGMPDMYQGTECPDLSLVDPDNRRAVDYARREALLRDDANPHPKLALIRKLLSLRAQAPELFQRGDYLPLKVEGPRSGNILAFRRSHEGASLVCAVMLRCADALAGRDDPVPGSEWWEGTAIVLDDAHERTVAASVAFANSPVFVELGS